jgi:hypothetical protein
VSAATTEIPLGNYSRIQQKQASSMFQQQLNITCSSTKTNEKTASWGKKLETSKRQQCQQQVCKEAARATVASFDPATPRADLTRLVK